MYRIITLDTIAKNQKRLRSSKVQLIWHYVVNKAN